MFHERPFIDDTLVLHKLGSSVLDFWFGGAVLINSLAAVAAFHNESRSFDQSCGSRTC